MSDESFTAEFRTDPVADEKGDAALFRPGSHASGKLQADSDVDLLVVMKHRGAAAEQAARIRRRIRAGFPLDIIVRSPAALQRRAAMGDGFIREILEKGKVLHESDDA